MPRGRPKKVIKKVKIVKAEAPIASSEVKISDVEIASTERIAKLRNLCELMLSESIHSIGDVEVKIQQEEVNLANIRNKK